MAKWRCYMEDGKFKMEPLSYHGPEGRIHIRTDEIPATESSADGKIYTSLSKMREAAKAAGCVEAGDIKKPINRRGSRSDYSEIDSAARRLFNK